MEFRAKNVVTGWIGFLRQLFLVEHLQQCWCYRWFPSKNHIRLTYFSPNCNSKCGICYQFSLMKIVYLILSNCTLHGARGSNPCYCHEEGKNDNNNNNNKSKEDKVTVILRSIGLYLSKKHNTKMLFVKA